MHRSRRRLARTKPLRRVLLSCEQLESRALPSVVHTNFLRPGHGGVRPDLGGGGPTGLTPAQIRHAYGADLVTFGAVAGDGTGQTIAVVDPFDQPNLASDLAAFDAFFGLAAPPNLTLINQNGGSVLPPPDAPGGWGEETTLDVEWAHVMAPRASLLVVEASSDFDSDLLTAVDTARNHVEVSVVSMSWGRDEMSGDPANDFHFTTPSGHIGVTFLAASGDFGSYSDTGSHDQIVGYPAASVNVVGVGGTTLTVGAGGSYVSESGWGNGTGSDTQGGSGGGISQFEVQPAYQAGVVTQSSTFRAVPDVAIDGDPDTGVPVYDTYDNGTADPWAQLGGTSLATPLWAGIIAVADQGRVRAGLGSLDGPGQTLPKLYALPAGDFHDITTGNNGYAAGPGYDLVTGRGSPLVNRVVNDLVTTTTTLSDLGPNPSTAGQTVSFTITVSPAIPNGESVSLEDASNGNAVVGTGSLNNGLATVTVSNLSVGTHNLVAVYPGDANNAASNSSPVAQTVNSAALWQGYARDAQHSAQSTVASQPLDAIRWQTPVDLNPQYSGNELLIHYGSPSITVNNSVLVPIKTGTSGGFEVKAFSGSNGAVLWTQTTDYQLPPSPGWTPSYSPTLTPSGRLYFAGNGGTVFYMDTPDAAGTAVSGQFAFYGIANYTANPLAYNGKVFINTPLTADSSGNIYFGFQVTGSNPSGLQSGIARVAPNGTATWVSAATAAGDTSIKKMVDNCAPALSPDGQTLYVAVNNGNSGVGNTGYLLALNSTTLAQKARVSLLDPSTGAAAYLPDDGTASPTVGPDGEVYFGVLEDPFPHFNDRGWLLQFSADLSQEKTPGAFGWDDTASVVPASMVPSYHGTSTYLLMTKYNNYASIGSGNGHNEIAVLDPNASESFPVYGGPNIQVMAEVLTILGATPDPEFDQTYPGAVREWCINNAVVDPATDSILANSEDGKLYRWNLATNSFTQVIVLTPGLGEAYTPTLIGADGTVYAVNNATLFAVGRPTGTTSTTTALTDNGPNPSSRNAAVSFTATVSGTNPTGTVDLVDADNANAVVGSGSLAGGTATITVPAGALAAGTHHLFAAYGGDSTFTPSQSSAAAQVVFATSGVAVNGSISPIISATEDGSGNVTVTTDGNNGFSAGEQISLQGASVAGYNGVWTVTAASNPAGGPFTFTFVDTNLGLANLGHSGTAAAAAGTGPLPGAQTSMVDALMFTFTSPVTLTAADFAISLHHNVTVNGVAGQTAGTLPTLTVTALNGGATYVVTFSGAGVSGGSIADGVYDLTVGGSVYTFGRLFGDITGSSVTNANGGTGGADPTANHGTVGVTAADKLRFNNEFNTTVGASGFEAGFDANVDGAITAADKLKFATNFNKSFSW
jgi:hypothetical protein